MERYTPFKFEEASKKDLNELIGEFKAQYGSFKDVKKDKDFKKLSDGDQEYVLDELKAEGTFKESSYDRHIEELADRFKSFAAKFKINYNKLDRKPLQKEVIEFLYTIGEDEDYLENIIQELKRKK